MAQPASRSRSIAPIPALCWELNVARPEGRPAAAGSSESELPSTVPPVPCSSVAHRPESAGAGSRPKSARHPSPLDRPVTPSPGWAVPVVAGAGRPGIRVPLTVPPCCPFLSTRTSGGDQPKRSCSRQLFLLRLAATPRAQPSIPWSAALSRRAPARDCGPSESPVQATGLHTSPQPAMPTVCRHLQGSSWSELSRTRDAETPWDRRRSFQVIRWHLLIPVGMVTMGLCSAVSPRGGHGRPSAYVAAGPAGPRARRHVRAVTRRGRLGVEGSEIAAV
jgi:hypothetical protein